MRNARVGDPTNPTAPQLLAGKERVRGFEADASGYVTPILISARQWKITSYPAPDGLVY